MCLYLLSRLSLLLYYCMVLTVDVWITPKLKGSIIRLVLFIRNLSLLLINRSLCSVNSILDSYLQDTFLIWNSWISSMVCDIWRTHLLNYYTIGLEWMSTNQLAVNMILLCALTRSQQNIANFWQTVKQLSFKLSVFIVYSFDLYLCVALYNLTD